MYFDLDICWCLKLLIYIYKVWLYIFFFLRLLIDNVFIIIKIWLFYRKKYLVLYLFIYFVIFFYGIIGSEVKFFGVVLVVSFGFSVILSISWGYIKMMGVKGLRYVFEVVIFNVNYMSKRLEGYYKIFYKNEEGELLIYCFDDWGYFLGMLVVC